MRSVCGCMPASSAATEIMYTPRLDSSFIRSAPVREQPLARVAVHRGGEVVDRLALLARERARHVDRQPVVDVAAPAAAELRRALAAQALHGAVLRPRRDADALGPAQRRDL